MVFVLQQNDTERTHTDMITTHPDPEFMSASYWALGFTLLGLTVSLLTVAYSLGFKRGLGQFRLSNPFGPAPIIEKPDPQIVQDYKIAKAGRDNALYRIYILERDYKELLEKHNALVERNKKSASAKRAETIARKKEASLGKA